MVQMPYPKTIKKGPELPVHFAEVRQTTSEGSYDLILRLAQNARAIQKDRLRETSEWLEAKQGKYGSLRSAPVFQHGPVVQSMLNEIS